MSSTRRVRFHGHIVGAGTEEGTRLVLGSWMRTPHGAFADVMVQRANGQRILLAPDDWVAEFVTATYTFDDVRVVPVRLSRTGTGRGSQWSVEAGPLTWSFKVGARSALGHLLLAVPRAIGATCTVARITDPVAARLVPGVRTLGTAGQGRTEWYAAHDIHTLTDSTVHWGSETLGRLAEVLPAPTFGFSSTPTTPSVTAVTTTIELPS